jgi:ribosome maturation factor RimP
MAAAATARLVALLEPVVAGCGADLEDVEVRPAGRRRLVRVVVDRDGGVDLDAVAEISRAVSEALDASDAMGSGPYVLEITSPGVDRPLTEPRHWRRARGRLVECALREGAPVTGRLLDVNGGVAVLDVDGRDRELRIDDVVRAVVQVEFDRADDAAGDGEG